MDFQKNLICLTALAAAGLALVLATTADWGALDKVDRFLSTHCQAPKIPDIYSNYCWSNDKGAGGECGNYKKEGDCWNREQ